MQRQSKDGTKLILDHATEIAFDAKDPRQMSLAKGRVVADVAHIEKHPAKITAPDGTIDVLGTKLVVTAGPKLLSVQVVRGEVAVTSNTSQRADVHAGEEAVIEGRKTVFVAILRAGTGFLDGMLEVIPGARVGHVGLYRDPKTLVAVEYYFKMPHGMHERDAIVLDPMLATGNSAVAAVDRLKETRPRSIRFVCLLAAPEGIKNFHGHHPEVPIYTAAIDEKLNDHGYIVPGLGDAGDRIFGTK